MEGNSYLREAGLFIVALIMTGCAAVAPLTSAVSGAGLSGSIEIHTQTAVRLEEGNFVTVRTNAVGSSKGFKLLGFITLYPATLDKAMNRLYAQARAEEGRPQTLAHLIVEHSGVYVILFSIPKVTARADLVEFLPPHPEPDDDSPSLNPGAERLLRTARQSPFRIRLRPRPD
jgi:hypothetical protein